ncbi:hypothetical protein [Pseudomonas phage Almagne]|nr:hypothetical protein [Pseudomonas phage Almagne]
MTITNAQAVTQSAVRNARRVNREVVRWLKEGYAVRAMQCADIRDLWMNEARTAQLHC